MKMKLEIEGSTRTIVLTPENEGEQQLLLAMRPFQPGEQREVTAVLEAEYSSDRPPYKKIVALRVVA